MFELFISNQLMCAVVDFDAYRVSRLYKLKIVMQRIFFKFFDIVKYFKHIY